jgi:hypothetical protein
MAHDPDPRGAQPVEPTNRDYAGKDSSESDPQLEFWVGEEAQEYFDSLSPEVAGELESCEPQFYVVRGFPARTAVLLRRTPSTPRRLHSLLMGASYFGDPYGFRRNSTISRVGKTSARQQLIADWAVVWCDMAEAFCRLSPALKKRLHQPAGPAEATAE